MKPLVSVIVPLYKSAHSFLETLHSILSQTYTHIEVILVNDGSPDDTGEIAAKCAAKHDQVRAFTKKNGGVGSARNHGIKHAQGDLIAFCDHDDIWEPTKLQKQVPLFDGASVGIVYSGSRLISIPGQIDYGVSQLYFDGQCFHDLLLENVIPSSSVVVRRYCLNRIGGFSERAEMQGVDEWHLWLRVAHEYEVRTVREPLITCVLTGENYSGNELRMMQAEICCLTDIFGIFPAQGRSSMRLYRQALAEAYLRGGATLLWQGHRFDARKYLKEGWQRTPLSPRFVLPLLGTYVPESARAVARRLKLRTRPGHSIHRK